MNILVTGGAGYIGSTISNFYARKGANVWVIDNLVNGNIKFLNKKIFFIKADISSKNSINKILKDNYFDLIIHCAALVDNAESIKYSKKYFTNNYHKSVIFLKRCIKNGNKNFIISSTAAVYGNINKKCNENNILNPQTPYAKSKLKLENFLRKQEINFAILRYFNVVGTERYMKSGFNIKNINNLFVALCKAYFEKKIFYINGNDHKTIDKTPIRDFIYIEDLVKIHILLGKLMIKRKKFKQIINCGYGKGLSVLTIVNSFQKILKKNIVFSVTKRRKKDISYSVSSNKKLIKLINFKSTNKFLEKMILTSYKWYSKERNSNL